MAKLKVVLLFGGKSSEHSISCATAAGVLGAIDRTKYDVIPVGITKQGLFVPAADDVQKWALRKGAL
ncbi:MAG: D-alanine--D-alanine ligase A, partial [Actinobacteria bacterium]|nr:D-alanine--D-alanine ligase A [Actinomycetota bacterium]